MLNHEQILFGDKVVRGTSEGVDRLVHSDNLPVLHALPDETIDLVYIDPPFGTGKRRVGRQVEQRYDDQCSDPEAFVVWLTDVLVESRRVLTLSGSLFVHLDHRTVHYVKVFLDRLFGRARFINELIWCYSVGGKSKRTFGRKHDTILWYAKTPHYAFYPEQVAVPRKPSSHMRVVTLADGELVQEKTDRKTGKVYRYPISKGKIPEDWWTDIELLNRSDKERTGWPTQKPTRLLARIVQGTTARGNTVADWFCGSGTTAVAAQAIGRGFLAVDRAESAIHCARTRLKEQGAQLALAGRPPNGLVVETSICGQFPRSLEPTLDKPPKNMTAL